MKPPGRYNRARAHRQFGYDNWIKHVKLGVDPQGLLRAYMVHVKADVPALQKRWQTNETQAMLIKVGHDWQAFTKWAHQWAKAQKSIAQ